MRSDPLTNHASAEPDAITALARGGMPLVSAIPEGLIPGCHEHDSWQPGVARAAPEHIQAADRSRSRQLGTKLAALWPRPRNPAMQLARAVLRLAGGEAELITHAERPWASITFCGSRHTLTLGFDGEAGMAMGEDFIMALPEHEFAIHRQLVADATVTGALRTLLPHPRLVVEAEILLLEEG